MFLIVFIPGYAGLPCRVAQFHEVVVETAHGFTFVVDDHGHTAFAVEWFPCRDALHVGVAGLDKRQPDGCHEFLLSRGISFARLHADGIDAVVSAITMRFKLPLKSGDEFVVRTSFEHNSFKYIFHQDIYRLPDMRLAIRATVDTVCVVNGQLSDIDIL